MPTGSSRAPVFAREETKRRLARLKGAASYDALLNALLDTASLAAVRARLVGPLDAPLHPVRRAGPATTDAPFEARRSADKQLLIAALARRRRELALRAGTLQRVGPRRYRLAIPQRPTKDTGGARIVRRPGRGLAA